MDQPQEVLARLQLPDEKKIGVREAVMLPHGLYFFGAGGFVEGFRQPVGDDPDLVLRDLLEEPQHFLAVVFRAGQYQIGLLPLFFQVGPQRFYRLLGRQIRIRQEGQVVHEKDFFTLFLGNGQVIGVKQTSAGRPIRLSMEGVPRVFQVSFRAAEG